MRFRCGCLQPGPRSPTRAVRRYAPNLLRFAHEAAAQMRGLRKASGGRLMSSARILILLLLTCLVSSVVLARGNAKTLRLDVAGGGLAKPISVTNRTLLDLSH